MFLDFDKKDYLIADVKFCYEENEFNPLDESTKIEFPKKYAKRDKSTKYTKTDRFYA